MGDARGVSLPLLARLLALVFALTACASPPTAVVGHYTQVVWQSTKKVGCGVALVTDADKATTAYCVCVYYPAGNYERQFRENV